MDWKKLIAILVVVAFSLTLAKFVIFSDFGVNLMDELSLFQK